MVILWENKTSSVSLFLGFVEVSYLTSKEKRLSSSVTSPMHFTFRPCRPFCLFTWELWQTPSPSEVCWGTLQKTCRSEWDLNLWPFAVWVFVIHVLIRPSLLTSMCAGCVGEFSRHSDHWWGILSAGWAASHHPQQHRSCSGVWTVALQLQQVCSSFPQFSRGRTTNHTWFWAWKVLLHMPHFHWWDSKSAQPCSL